MPTCLSWIARLLLATGVLYAASAFASDKGPAELDLICSGKAERVTWATPTSETFTTHIHIDLNMGTLSTFCVDKFCGSFTFQHGLKLFYHCETDASGNNDCGRVFGGYRRPF